MAIKGKQKAGVAAKKRKTKSEARVIRRSLPGRPSPMSTPELSTPSRPSIPLDVASHPYILQQIINESSPSTLAALLQCSKHIFQIAAPALYRYPRTTGEQFTAMLSEGNGPSKRGASSGMLGRGFSPFLREALQHARSLHIVDFDLKTAGPPSIPRDVLNSVNSVVIHTAEGWYVPEKLPFPTGLLAMKPARLYLRLASHDPDTAEGCNFLHSKLPPSVKQIHCLVPAHCAMQFAPNFLCGAWWLRDSPKIRSTVTVVLLPRAPGILALWLSSRMGPVYHRSGTIPDRFCEDLVSASRSSTIRLVGSEYFGLLDDGRSACALSATIHQQGTPAPSLTFCRFREWLDDQEPGAVFSAEEGRDLRALDEKYIAQLEATATAAPA